MADMSCSNQGLLYFPLVVFSTPKKHYFAIPSSACHIETIIIGDNNGLEYCYAGFQGDKGTRKTWQKLWTLKRDRTS
jgi:hypothetical protein